MKLAQVSFFYLCLFSFLFLFLFLFSFLFFAFSLTTNCLFKGEFVAPEKLEVLYIESKYIDQIFIHVDSLRSYLLAVVVPNEPVLLQWVEEHWGGVKKTIQSLFKYLICFPFIG